MSFGRDRNSDAGRDGSQMRDRGEASYDIDTHIKTLADQKAMDEAAGTHQGGAGTRN
jgi:hypothetical protein